MKENFKRLICVFSAALIAAVLVSCGSDESDESSQSNAEQTQTDVTALTAEEVADNLFNGIEYTDELNTISNEMIEKLYGISEDKYTSARVYVGGVSTAEEIACFDAADETAAQEIKQACEDRISDQIAAVEDYNPDELVKLNNPVLVTSGNSVYMCLSNDNDAAKYILGQ